MNIKTQNITFICENCKIEHDGTYGSGRFCSDHCRRVYSGKRVNINGNHKSNLNKNKHKSPYGTWKCECCNLIFETRAQLFSHNHEVHPITKGSSWNKGLTKETDARIAKYVKTNYNRNQYGKTTRGISKTLEQRKKISDSMKKFYKEHLELIPYKLHHSSKESYPEKYFNELLIKEDIKNYTRNLPVCGYFLDFGFKDKKIDFEVDGSQHWLDKKIIEHDKKRNQTLIDNGWTVIRMRWDNWQKMSFEEKQQWITDFKSKI